MKTAVRLIAILLAITMLMSLVACAQSQDEQTDETSQNDSTTVAEEVTTDGCPVENHEYNKTFNMLELDYRKNNWYYSEGFTGEILNDAVYTMMLEAKDRLGVTVTWEGVSGVTGSEIYDKVKPTYDAGDDVYQMCIMHPYYSISALISKNMLTDFKEFESVNLDKEYWNGEQMKALEVDEKQYLGLGSICSYALYILYVNKKLATDLSITVPYEQVRNGEWTLDDFMTISNNCYKDDGDSMKNNKDRYGFACLWDANGSAFQQACGIYTLTMNKDTEQYEITIYNDKTVDVFEKVEELCTRESSYIWYFDQRENSNVTMSFEDGNILFTHQELSNRYLNAAFGVGILPMPKYDTNQKEYAHVNWGNLITVPATVAKNNMSMVGDTLELMAYYGYTNTQPAYYETVLGSRVADTEDDWDMIQIIYDTVVFDPGIAFCDSNSGLNSLTYLFCFTIRFNKKLASYYKTNVKSAQKGINKLFGYTN